MKIVIFVPNNTRFPVLANEQCCVANNGEGDVVLALWECNDQSSYANNIIDNLGREEKIFRIFHGNSGEAELTSQLEAANSGDGFSWGESRPYSRVGGESGRPLDLAVNAFNDRKSIKDLVSYLDGTVATKYGIKLLELLFVEFIEEDMETLYEVAERGEKIAVDLDELTGRRISDLCREFWRTDEVCVKREKFEQVRDELGSHGCF